MTIKKRKFIILAPLCLATAICFIYCYSNSENKPSDCCNESSAETLRSSNNNIYDQYEDYDAPQYEDDSLRNYIEKLIKIDSVGPPSAKTNQRSSTYIKKRIEAMIGRSTKELVESKGCKYPPKYVLFRTFKLERIFEIWIGDNNKDSLRKLIELPICSADFEPGTKLVQGDGKTPEGYYSCKLHYGSSYDFMWMNLNYNEIHDEGKVRVGSSFKICINYPHDIDRYRTRTYVSKTQSAGGEICIHGNCVTAGCISFRNKNFLPVFHLANNHNKEKYGLPLIYIYPFKFSIENIEKYSVVPSNPYWDEQKLDSLHVTEFWKNLEVGYDLFEKERHALKITRKNNKYSYRVLK